MMLIFISIIAIRILLVDQYKVNKFDRYLTIIYS